MDAPLISSQRFLDHDKVMAKAARFSVFIVRVVPVMLRGKKYRVLVDGHHNLAAARLKGVEPTWRGPAEKWRRIISKMTPTQMETFLINNLTDSDWYFVESGQTVEELEARA